MFKGQAIYHLIVVLILVIADVGNSQHLPPVKVANAGGVKRIRSMSLSSGKPLSAAVSGANVHYIKGKDGKIIVAASSHKKREKETTDSWGWHRDAVFSPLD